ncbi:MAG: hypothetical protein IPL49_07530 [Saprospirales bacterium]|nr:hypothetical protein [Saprospirales bacterium]
MLQIFKTNQILGAVLFLFYLGLFYASNLVATLPVPEPTPGILSHLVAHGIEGWSSIYLHVSSMLLVFFQAILIVVMVNGNRINNESNLLPGVFYCLFASMVPEFMYPSPVLMGNTFLLLALLELMGVYKIPIASGRLYNVGFWISVASLFYFSNIGLLAFAIWGTSTLRAYNIRDQITIFFGAITPYFLTGTVFFLLNRLPEFWSIQFSQNLAFLDFQGGQHGLFYLKMGIFIILILVALLSNTTYFQKRIMQVQKKISLLYGFLLFSGLIILFQSQLDISHWLIAVIPLAAFFSISFSTMPTQWAEVVHLLMLVGGMALAYSPWLIRGF